MNGRLKILLPASIAGIVIILAYLYSVLYLPASSMDTALKTIEVPRGTSFRMVAEELRDEGIIKSSDRFLLAARLMGALKKTKAGEYDLSASMTPAEILTILVEGRVKTHPVTIPEGFNINEIASALSGIVDPEEFIRRATDPELTASLGFPGRTLEGYLFPDTYRFTRGMTPDEIIRTMTSRFREVYYPELDGVAKEKRLSLNKVITLASIIEKETGSGDERPLISAVFHNRLKKRIRLQSDPTVIYGIRNFDGNLTKKHLQTRTPYNTYTNYGLPPGPIANPGRASIEASLNPADEEYLYFVSRNDGTHHFSRTLREHNNAVNRYQRAGVSGR